MSIVIEHGVVVAGAPAEVFAFLHDPARRQEWDAMVDLCQLEGERPRVGARLHLRGRRTAPSWVGEYVEFDPPRRSVVRLVEGVGMPFAAFGQTLAVTDGASGTRVSLRLEYQPAGAGRLLEPLVLRPRLSKAVRASVGRIERRFG